LGAAIDAATAPGDGAAVWQWTQPRTSQANTSVIVAPSLKMLVFVSPFPSPIVTPTPRFELHARP